MTCNLNIIMLKSRSYPLCISNFFSVQESCQNLIWSKKSWWVLSIHLTFSFMSVTPVNIIQIAIITPTTLIFFVNYSYYVIFCHLWHCVSFCVRIYTPSPVSPITLTFLEPNLTRWICKEECLFWKRARENQGLR